MPETKHILLEEGIPYLRKDGSIAIMIGAIDPSHISYLCGMRWLDERMMPYTAYGTTIVDPLDDEEDKSPYDIVGLVDLDQEFNNNHPDILRFYHDVTIAVKAKEDYIKKIFGDNPLPQEETTISSEQEPSEEPSQTPPKESFPHIKKILSIAAIIGTILVFSKVK